MHNFVYDASNIPDYPSIGFVYPIITPIGPFYIQISFDISIGLSLSSEIKTTNIRDFWATVKLEASLDVELSFSYGIIFIL